MYKKRIEKTAEWLKNQGLGCAVLEDTEDRRTSALRYLSGMNQDALLFIYSTGKTVLVPWDENLARKIAQADEILPYTEFKRDFATAVSALATGENGSPFSKIEISGETPYPVYREISQLLPGVEILCRKEGISDQIDLQKTFKDTQEMEYLEKACHITDRILEGLCRGFEENSIKTELEAALFIEMEARKLGAEGSGFDIIAAGPERSFGIHAFPTFSNASLEKPGLSIFDFGVRYQGYTSDVTLTLVRGKTSVKQETMISLVEEAYNLAKDKAVAGADTREIALLVDRVFEKQGYTMPHSLGHGIGLDVHESPLLRSRDKEGTELKEGMVFTLEPGLYDPEAGGVRLENDFAITRSGTRVLTNSRILRIQ